MTTPLLATYRNAASLAAEARHRQATAHTRSRDAARHLAHLTRAHERSYRIIAATVDGARTITDAADMLYEASRLAPPGLPTAIFARYAADLTAARKAHQ